MSRIYLFFKYYVNEKNEKDFDREKMNSHYKN